MSDATVKLKKRPTDAVSNAVHVMKVLAGKTEYCRSSEGSEAKHQSAKAKGREGGIARARSLSKQKRSEIAKREAKVRWPDDLAATSNCQ